MRITFLFLITSLMISCASKEDENKNESFPLDLSIAIPPKGNTWVVDDVTKNHYMIQGDGIRNWTDSNNIIRTYFHTESVGELRVGLSGSQLNGNSTIKITVGQDTKEMTIDKTTSQKLDAGIFNVVSAGYHFIEIQGVEKTATTFGDIDMFWVGGPATKGKVTFVKDDFHWGRRGPSVHLTYTTPEDMDILWFYNEVTVPEGEDVVGSFFMANGFGEGYFGIQVNSETERRVLFSVWSPFKTQNPKDIPEDYKIILLGKGEGVTSGEFGNEGSGGQSYKVFDWKAGNQYKFLLKGESSVNNSTDYTAYFFAPEENEWKLIASFRRPHTTTYLTRPHSFLENFRTEAGCISRKANYCNQWVMDANENWHELTKAKFTADATARKGARLDYKGGSEGNIFFMRNCGFFSDKTVIESFYERVANGIAPEVDIEKLPLIP